MFHSLNLSKNESTLQHSQKKSILFDIFCNLRSRLTASSEWRNNIIDSQALFSLAQSNLFLIICYITEQAAGS